MINIQADKTLSLLTPNTNKALAKLMQNATPQELKQLSQNSDIKTVLNSLFDKTLSGEKSDKLLLEILKNSNTFKDMGSFSKDLGVLQKLIKSQDIPQKIQTAILGFIKSIEGIDAKVLQNQISNSGVFLESKLAKSVDTKAPLKALLQELQPLLEKNTTQEAKQTLSEVKTLLQKLTLADTPKVVNQDNFKSLQALAKNVQKITSALQGLHVKADTLHSKPMQTVVESLQANIQPQNKALHVKSVLPQMQELYALVLQSRNPDSSSLLGALEKIVSLLNTIDKSTPLNQTKIPQEIHKFIDSLHVSIKKDGGALRKEIMQVHERLLPYTKAEALSTKQVMSERIVHDMKANILHVSQEIQQTSTLQNSDLSKIVDKLALQIDYYQLYSHLNNSSSLYLPFVWEGLEEGSLSIKKLKDKKFYCEINLNLKEHGELRVMLSLYDDNQINIHLFTQSEDFKEALQKNISTLRSAFVEADLTLREVRFFDKEAPKKSGYTNISTDLDMGFEVKV